MPRRSIWKGSFVDAFLLRMKKKISLLLNRKIGSRRSSILPEFVDCSVRIYNGKTPLRCKITEEKVGHKESLLLHGNEDFREQGPEGEKVKKKRIWHEKEIRFR
nr:ribosomal protein S19 [Morus notabilis]QBB08762.1 ribosomal protein S19 [Morus notabilis]